MTGFSLSETASRMTSMLSASRRCRCVKLVTKLPRFPRLRAGHSPRLCITRGLIVSLEIAPGGPPEARIHRCGRRLSCGVAEASRAGHQAAAHVRYAARAESAADRVRKGIGPVVEGVDLVTPAMFCSARECEECPLHDTRRDWQREGMISASS